LDEETNGPANRKEPAHLGLGVHVLFPLEARRRPRLATSKKEAEMAYSRLLFRARSEVTVASEWDSSSRAESRYFYFSGSISIPWHDTINLGFLTHPKKTEQ